MAVDSVEYVLLAKLGKAHGLKGEVRIFPYPGMPSDLSFCQEVLLQYSDSLKKKHTVDSIRRQGKFFVAKFKAVNNRNEAELLKAVDLFVHKSVLPESADDSLYWHEYEGVTVWTDKGQELGNVEQIFSTGAHDIMVVTGKGSEFLIPIIDDIMVETDLTAGKIVVSPMPGLLEINS